jgi:hypothetical protein
VFRAVAIGLGLVACGDNIDEFGQSHDISDQLTEWLTANGAVHGTVYRCESGAECLDQDTGEPTNEEWCWKQDDESGIEAALEARTGTSSVDCWPIGVDERWFPAVAGCAYACPLTVPGSNAHCGVLCP